MSNMLRHRNKPYGCGCCYPYWDKRKASRASERHAVAAEIAMENEIHQDSLDEFFHLDSM